MTATPLLERIEARRNRRIGPLCPVPSGRLSEFAKRLAEKRLPVTDTSLYNGSFTPSGERGAA